MMKMLWMLEDVLVAVLERQAKKDDLVSKVLVMEEVLQKARRVYAIGDYGYWNGGTYVKVENGKWRRVSGGHRRRGGNLAGHVSFGRIASLKRKIKRCTNGERLTSLIKENRVCFGDYKGVLRFIERELREYNDFVKGLGVAKKEFVELANVVHVEGEIRAGKQDEYDNEPVGKDVPCYETMASDERQFYTMTRAELVDYIKKNVARDIFRLRMTETKTLADFCRAYVRVKEFVPNLSKLKYFSGYEWRKVNSAAYYNGLAIVACQVDMEGFCEAAGKKEDENRRMGRIANNAIRDSGNAVRDVFIHEFGHVVDVLKSDDELEQRKIDLYEKCRKEGTCVTLYGGADEEKDHEEHAADDFFAECFATYVIFGRLENKEQEQLVLDVIKKVVEPLVIKALGFANLEAIHKSVSGGEQTMEEEEVERMSIEEAEARIAMFEAHTGRRAESPSREQEEAHERRLRDLEHIIKTSNDPEEVKKAKEAYDIASNMILL